MLMTSERISFVFYCKVLSLTDQSYLTNIMINEIHNKIKFVNLKQAKYILSNLGFSIRLNYQLGPGLLVRKSDFLRLRSKVFSDIFFLFLRYLRADSGAHGCTLELLNSKSWRAAI